MGHVPKEPTSVAKGTYRGRHRRQPHQLAPHFLQPAEIKEKEVIVTAWMDSVVVQKNYSFFKLCSCACVLGSYVNICVCMWQELCFCEQFEKALILKWEWVYDWVICFFVILVIVYGIKWLMSTVYMCVMSDWWMDSHASWHCNK